MSTFKTAFKAGYKGKGKTKISDEIRKQWISAMRRQIKAGNFMGDFRGLTLRAKINRKRVLKAVKKKNYKKARNILRNKYGPANDYIRTFVKQSPRPTSLRKAWTHSNAATLLKPSGYAHIWNKKARAEYLKNNRQWAQLLRDLREAYKE